MFEPNPNYPQFYGFFDRSYPGPETDLVNRAVRLFNAAISRGRFANMKRWITRKSGHLLDLNQLQRVHLRGQYYDGIRPVALHKIRGSLGRMDDFDCDFNPLDIRLRDRWQSIAMACLHDNGLRPVELIRVGGCYYVVDGHHRISVARALGKWAIDAEVTVWVVPQSIPNDAVLRAEPQVQLF